MIKGFFTKQKAYIRKILDNGVVIGTRDRDYAKEEKWHQQMLNAGFQYNEEYDFYYTDEGALMLDQITPTEDYMNIPVIAECSALGYELGYGAASPFGKEGGYSLGLYCKNYEEILEKYKEENKGERNAK
jgi:hypothetical protein